MFRFFVGFALFFLFIALIVPKSSYQSLKLEDLNAVQEDDKTCFYDSNGILVCEETGKMRHWYNKAGEVHRENGPAIECLVTGDMYWLQYGVYHRIDGPAVEMSNGSKQWFINGEFQYIDRSEVNLNERINHASP